MKRIVLTVLMLATSAALIARGEVGNFGLFKIAVYHQIDAAAPIAPDAPNAYYFGAQLHTTGGEYAKVAGEGPAGHFDMSEVAARFFNFGSPYFSDKKDLDDAYPGGTYEFAAGSPASGAEFGTAVIPNDDLYPESVAAFTPDCWMAMRQVDPTRGFALHFNSFTPAANCTAAFTFIKIVNAVTGENVFEANLLSPDTVAVKVPANTLRYGAIYRVGTFFSDREERQNAGFGSAFSTVGFDNLTYTSLTTIAPALNITAAGGNIKVTWPVQAANYRLEWASQLPAGSDSWSTITNVPAAARNNYSLTIPPNRAARFFRLKPL